MNGEKNDGEKKKKKKNEDLLNAAIIGSSHETIQRYGSAAKQYYVAYSGVDYEKGQTLAKGLKQIANEKVNPNYKFQNHQQQMGYGAEVIDVARTNSENKIKGNSTRKVRTDDLGRVNDPLYDTVMLDEHGNIIEGSGAQMKFLGASQSDVTGKGAAARALNKLQSKKFQKYLDANAKIDVPSNQYDGIVSEINKRTQKNMEQLEYQKQAGNVEQAQRIQEKIDKLNKIKKNLRKSTVSSDEARFARMHPKLSTAQDVAKISHRAGMQVAKYWR